MKKKEEEAEKAQTLLKLVNVLPFLLILLVFQLQVHNFLFFPSLYLHTVTNSGHQNGESYVNWVSTSAATKGQYILAFYFNLI